MEMTKRDVRLARDACRSIMTMPVHHTIAARINQLARALDGPYDDSEVQRKRLVEEHAAKNDDGSIVERSDDRTIVFKTPGQFEDEWTNALREIVDVTINGFQPIPVTEILPAVRCEECEILVRAFVCPSCEAEIDRPIPAQIVYGLAPFLDLNPDKPSDEI